MQANQLLDDLTESVLDEISKFGLSRATNRFYRQACNSFKVFAATRASISFTETLAREFQNNTEERYKANAIGTLKWKYLRRFSLLLGDYAANGKIKWKQYAFKHQPMPISSEFLLLYSSFIDNHRYSGKSDNTIQSAQNSVRQFLIFLEDSGCSTLSMATPSIMPLFFQHMHATYCTSSIAIMASNIRSFLRFAAGGEILLSAVPSHCVREKTIIPILSDEERDALTNVLKTPRVLLRDKAIILLALRTGLRAVDIIKMKLSDIDWINDTISITQSKTGKGLKVPIPIDVGNVLSAYILNERPKIDDPSVFLTLLAPFRPLSGHATCYDLVRRTFHQAGIRLGSERKGLHVLRHSVASRMLSKGVPLTTISSILGHSNKSSTDAYLQTNEARMRECSLGIAGISMNCEALK